MTLHIAPGDSAAGSMREAFREAGRDHDVLACLDDLSCGPIATNDPQERAAWWAPYYPEDEFERVARFWERLTKSDEQLVLWFSRNSAREFAGFLACADRLGNRPYAILDATRPSPSYVSIMQPGMLASLDGSERIPTEQELEGFRERWQQLKRENAPFRIVESGDLISAPLEHFDRFLLNRAALLGSAGPTGVKITRVVGEVLGVDCQPYNQVGDIMLLARVVALIESGKLVADGDPWDMHSTRIRLPD